MNDILRNQILDRLNTTDIDLHGRRVTGAADSVNPSDYITQRELKIVENSIPTATTQVIDAVKGASNLKVSGTLTKIAAFGKLTESSIVDDGTYVFITGENFGVGLTTPVFPIDVVGDINTSTFFMVGGIKLSGKNLTSSFIASPNRSSTLTSTVLQVNSATAPAGIYRVTVYAATRTAGIGNIVLAVGWNDGIGAKTIGPTMNLTAGNSTILTIPLYSAGSANITVTATYTATGAYDIYATLEQLT